MKKIITLIAIMLFSIIIYAQNKNEVESVTLNNKIYEVGDTIQLNVGSMKNGDFQFIMCASATSIGSQCNASWAGTKGIIYKILNWKPGTLNATYLIYFKANGYKWEIRLQKAILFKEIIE